METMHSDDLVMVHLWLVNYGPSCMGGLAEAIICAACLRAHDDLCCLVRIGAIMAWVYPSWPACSFTAELCVVYNSPTSIIGIV